MNKKFLATIHGGKMMIQDTDLFQRFISTQKDGEYDLIIKNHKRTRSNQQNRYYWGVIIRIIADETGHSDNEVHEHMKWRFLRKRGGKLETVRSTTDLSTSEFEEYTENIRRFAATELQCQVPIPNEIDYED